MNSIDILIEVEGTWCNDWPCFKVVANNHTYYDQQVVGKKIIEFKLPVDSVNSLTLEHYGKSFGENNRWDTEVVGDKIVNDRAIRPLRLELNGVDIIKYITRWPFCTADGQQLTTDYYGYNGQVTIEFTDPVYDWIITNLVRSTTAPVAAQDLILETSHSSLFDYDQDLIELEEIEKLLATHARLLNKSS